MKKEIFIINNYEYKKSYDLLYIVKYITALSFMSRATQHAIIMDYWRAVLFVRCTVCVCNMLYINFVIILCILMHFLIFRRYVTIKFRIFLHDS